MSVSSLCLLSLPSSVPIPRIAAAGVGSQDAHPHRVISLGYHSHGPLEVLDAVAHCPGCQCPAQPCCLPCRGDACARIYVLLPACFQFLLTVSLVSLCLECCRLLSLPMVDLVRSVNARSSACNSAIVSESNTVICSSGVVYVISNSLSSSRDGAGDLGSSSLRVMSRVIKVVGWFAFRAGFA